MTNLKFFNTKFTVLLFFVFYLFINIFIIYKFSVTPLVMDDEVSYIINTHNLVSLFNNHVGDSLPFSQRPLGYSILLALPYGLLTQFHLNNPRNTYIFFLLANLLFSVVSLSLIYIFLRKTISNTPKWIVISILVVISLYPSFFYYNFFSLTEALIVLITTCQLLLSFFCLRNIYSRLTPLYILVISLLCVFFTITKETGIVSILVPLWIGLSWSQNAHQKYSNNIFAILATFFIVLIIFGLIAQYRISVQAIVGLDFFDRGGNISVAFLIKQITSQSSLMKIMKSLVSVVFCHMLYGYTLTLGLLVPSFYFLVDELRTAKIKKINPTSSLHLLSFILIIVSICLSAFYFSFYSTIGTLRFDHYFYERYTYPFFLFYFITLIPLFPKLLLKVNKVNILTTFFSTVLLIIITHYNELHINNLNIAAFYHLFNITQATVLYIIFFAILLIAFYRSILNFLQHRKDFNTLILIHPTVALIILLLFNNIFLFKNNYIFEQQRNKSLNEIHSYINNNYSDLNVMCFYKDGKISFQYWHHRYYLSFNGIDSSIVTTDEINNCNAIIVDEAIFENDNFTLTKRLNGANTKLYLKKSSL